MAAKPPESCDVHLEGTLVDGKEAKKLAAKLKRSEAALLDKALDNPQKHKDMRDLLIANMKYQIEDGLDIKVRQVSDLVRVQDLVNKFTKDPISGETLKSASDVIHNRLKSLVGRNSVDTRLRALRNHLRNHIDQMESTFKTHENPNFKSIRDIKGGSDEERILFKKVHDFTEQMDVDNLSPEMVNGYLKKYPDEMDRLALSMVAYNEYARKAMGKYGVSVKFNHNYVMKRRYDWAALEKLGHEGFADYMVKKLNIKQTFGEGATDESARLALRDIFDDFKTNAANRTSVMDTGEVAGSKANSMARKFFYKDSDAAYDTFRDLSVGGMREQFEKNAMSMASTAIKVSEFGYDSKMVLAKVNEKLGKTYKEPRGKIDQWREARIVQAEQDLAGNQNLVQGGLTNFSNNVRFMQAFTKLGTTLSTTAADAVENARQVFYVNGDVLGGSMEWTNNMRKMLFKYNKQEKQEIANILGLVFSHQSNAEGMRLASGDLATNGGALTRMIQEHGGKALNIATLLPSQTGMSKISSGLVGASSFSKLVNAANQGKLNKFQTDTLKEYQFTKQEIALLGSDAVQKTSNWSDTPIHTGSNIRKLLEHKGGPDFIAAQLGVKPEMAGQAVLDMATKYESFINDFVTRGTPTPELATKTLLFKGVENEPLRVAISLATQFMDTPLAQAESFVELARKLKRINTKDGKLELAGITGDVLAHSAVYLPTAIALYGAADAAMSLVTNSESVFEQIYSGDSDTRRRAITRAISRSGFVPYLAEVIDNQWGGGYNKTALDTFGGPNYSTMRDVFKLAQSNDEGGLEFSEFIRRQGPSNAIPVRALNNWVGQARGGEKIWDDNKGTFFGN